MSNFNLYFPQYQGSGANKAIAIGAQTLFEEFSKTMDFATVECSQELSPRSNNIYAYDVLLENFSKAKNLIEQEKPEKIFLLGGDLDAIDPRDVPYVRMPTPDWMRLAELIELIDKLKSNFNLVRQSITEYTGQEFLPELEGLIVING